MIQAVRRMLGSNLEFSLFAYNIQTHIPSVDGKKTDWFIIQARAVYMFDRKICPLGPIGTSQTETSQ